MLHHTRGIFLRKIKYGESSFIAKIYTEEFGVVSYIIRGVGSRKKKQLAFYQSLSLLDMIVYAKPSRAIQQIKEIKQAYTFKNIHTDIYKSTIVLFLNEVLYHAIREEEKNSQLFDFIFESLVKLDQTETGISIFHLLFMVKLSSFLGINPQNNFSDANQYFDLSEACFKPDLTLSQVGFDQEISKGLHILFSLAEKNQLNPVSSITRQRKRILNGLVDYFRFHLEGFPEMKSLSVLQSVFE